MASVASTCEISPESPNDQPNSPLFPLVKSIRPWPSEGTLVREKDSVQEQKRCLIIADAVKTILTTLGEDVTREGLLKTPMRYAKALMFFTSGYETDLKKVLNEAVFEEDCDEMVIVKNIDIYSLCEHHMVPFTGKVFTKFVEVGRVVLINYGPDVNKPAVIVDIVDHSRALVDGPTTGVARQVIAFKRILLTNIVVKIPRTAGSAAIAKALTAQDFQSTWDKSHLAKKLAVKAIRKNLSDFDRFKIMVAKKEKRAIVNKQFNKLKKISAYVTL